MSTNNITLYHLLFASNTLKFERLKISSEIKGNFKLQGGPYVSERFYEAVLRSLGDFKLKKINSSEKFMQLPLKVNKEHFL